MFFFQLILFIGERTGEDNFPSLGNWGGVCGRVLLHNAVIRCLYIIILYIVLYAVYIICILYIIYAVI